MAEPAAAFTLETFTAGDGYRWQYRRYLPAGQPRGQVVCLHGIQSHGGWYDWSCSKLCEAGYEVYFLDRRGSGLNQESRGDTPSYQRLLEDVAEFLKARREAATPVFLVGISWGGKLATALQKSHPGLADGLVLLCPGICPKVRPTFRQRLGIGISWLFAPRRRFPIPLNNPELFTATPRWQQFIHDDPLALRDATARLLIESLRLDRYLREVPGQVALPVLLQLAEHDRIIDNARTRDYVRQFASKDVQVKEYPGAHHTLEFEPEPEHFLSDMLQWLEQHQARS